MLSMPSRDASVVLSVALTLVACASAPPPEPALCPAPSRPRSAPVRARRRVRIARVVPGAHGGVLVPESAVTLDPTGVVVFVVEHGRARRRTVSPAAREDGRARIEGVREGERVLVDPRGLYDGEAVVAPE